MPRTTLLLLPAVGAEARSWDGAIAALGDAFDVVVPDLPGDAEAVAARLRELAPDVWLVAGHGTGGGVATAVTAWAEAGERGLIAPAGLGLVAAAPECVAAAGSLRTPVVVVEGADDAGPDGEVARRLLALWDDVRERPRLPPAFARLIASDRVAARTRRVMLARLDEPGEDAPRALSPAQRGLLTAMLDRVVPQRGTAIDLAGRIDVRLASGQGDGWRFAELPPDEEAWRRGLDTVAALEPAFASLPAPEQDAAIDRIAVGEAGSDDPALLSAARMALWFQDVQAEAVRAWLSHPATQAWLRYDGFADGGDGPIKQGFTTTHAGEWEAWQRDWRTGEELRA